MWRLIQDPIIKDYYLENFEENLLVDLYDNGEVWTTSISDLIEHYNDDKISKANETYDEENVTLELYLKGVALDGWKIIVETENPNTIEETHPELFL